jgi:hypothetical protein
MERERGRLRVVGRWWVCGSLILSQGVDSSCEGLCDVCVCVREREFSILHCDYLFLVLGWDQNSKWERGEGKD